MKLRLQIGGLLLALGISAGMAMPCVAQKPHANAAPQNHPATRPAKPPKASKQADRPPRNAGGQKANAKTQGNANASVNRPPNASSESASKANVNPNRPPNATVHSRDLTPQQRQNLPRLNQLSPQEKQEMRDRARVWGNLTPEQRQHIKNDIVPRWQQMSPERKRAIRQRLGVLQNMPESARNQHLNDPNFTRGMSEEDKAMLRDLSHMHVGGAPEPPME